jgi:hypothetical protein
VDNAIWLCQTCAALVDRDVAGFSSSILHEWKRRAEHSASLGLRARSVYRAISPGEVYQELSIAERGALKALEAEFGCSVRPEIHVPAGDGRLRLHGAVVRGETLIGIDIHENNGNGIAYFQIEYLLELCSKLKFDRFQSCALFIVVVSAGTEESDSLVRLRLQQMFASSDVETHLRLYRLLSLRAQFDL